MPTGVIKKWVDGKGFGFIEPGNGDEDIFAHASDFLGGDSAVRHVRQGDEVRYSVGHDDKKNKPRAAEIEVTKSSGRKRKDSRSRSRSKSRSRSRGRGRGDGRGRPQDGKVISWNESGGFGFIQPAGEGEDTFCHVSQLVDGEGSVGEGDMVTFTRVYNEHRQKYQAEGVRRVGGGGGNKRRGRGGSSRSPSRRGGKRGGSSRSSSRSASRGRGGRRR